MNPCMSINGVEKAAGRTVAVEGTREEQRRSMGTETIEGLYLDMHHVLEEDSHHVMEKDSLFKENFGISKVKRPRFEELNHGSSIAEYGYSLKRHCLSLFQWRPTNKIERSADQSGGKIVEIKGMFKLEPLGNVDPEIISEMGLSSELETMRNLEMVEFQDIDFEVYESQKKGPLQEYIRDLEREEEDQMKIRMEELRKAERKNRDEFRKLMEEHVASGVLTPSTHWRDYCMKVKDLPAYLAVSSNTSGSTAKDLFEDVAGELQKQEYIRDLEREEEEQMKIRMEELRKAECKNRDEFRKLMEEHVASGVLTPSTHWRDYCMKVKDLPAYLAVSSNTSGSTAKDLFEDVAGELQKQEYIRDLEREEEEQMKIRMEELRKAECKNRDKFRKLMEEHVASGVLTPSTHWRDYCMKVKDLPAYLAVSSNTSGSTAKDLFEVVAEELQKQEYIRDLEREEEEQMKIRMEELRKAERKNRDEFRKLMEEHVASGVLTPSTHWRDYCMKVKDLPAYLAVSSNTSGSTAKDLFEVVAEELQKQYVEDKARIKDAMKLRKIALSSTWTLEDFKAALIEDITSQPLSEINLKLVFDELQERVKKKEQRSPFEENSEIRRKRRKKDHHDGSNRNDDYGELRDREFGEDGEVNLTLQKLVLRNCKRLMELPPGIGELTNLEVLDLEGTEILFLPKEIAKLVNLTCLKVSFYGHANQTVIPRRVLSNLSRLNELIIDVTPCGEWWDVEVEAIIDDICSLKELRTLKLYLPTAELLEKLTLMVPGLTNFRFTVGRYEEHFISRLRHDAEEEFNNAEKLEKCLKYINGSHIPNEITKVIKHANAFFLQRHWTAGSLSEFRHENMNELKFFLVMECNEFRTIIDSELFYQGKDGRGETEDLQDLDESIVLGSLERLIIRYMKNMVSFWKGPVGKGSLANLKFLSLHTCPNLTTLFTIDMLSNLRNLEELIVEDCPKIDSLVSPKSSGSKSDLFLPSLKKISLLELPELVSISSGLCIAPKLERMVIFYCPKLEKLSAMDVSSENLKVIKGEKEWWDALKWYESDLSKEHEDYLTSRFIPLRRNGDLFAQLTKD
ncbi:hypothetical protein Vadar_005772 [Vaccinium darrowii]|uniref:Uncharacterized protein n=1 Tax=Vaccinium darrowii TaxID=229202 RepID=A0ACB7WYH7_9ERIC|nr:hypothetical protein Vadar_005772 [Vaccinium darrowii]